MRAISNFCRRLRRSTSGNAVMLVAAGLPALIGGTGFAVDMTQWYMWKSELQYAVDQAAIAGAYARANEATETTYETRAQQEFALNLDKTADLDTATDPVALVSLEDWGTGEDNSVVVSASVTHSLPFSSFLTGSPTTIGVSAQAAFEEGENFTSCLVAVDPDAEGAVTIGGSAEFVAGCGIAALSTDPNAIKVNGNPTIDAGWLISRGGIDDWFDTHTEDTVREDVGDSLIDPFGCEGAGLCLTPPNNPDVRTYSCPKGKTTSSGYIADSVTTRTEISYLYYKKSGNNYTLQSGYRGTGYKANSDDTSTATNVALTAMPSSTVVIAGPTAGNYDVVAGSGNNRIYERATTKVTTTYVNARLNETTAAGGAAVLEPGTYSDLTLKCDTVFTGGIYVINGGSLTIHSQYNVVGAGVMFVLKNGAGITINGGANINLTAMTVPQLEAAKAVPTLTTAEVQKLAGMLIFEDPDSSGNSKNKINGNSTTILNGTVYLPVSNLDIQGSAGVTAQCLMLVASTVTLTGNVEMTSFCPPDVEEDTLVSSTQARVRLVS